MALNPYIRIVRAARTRRGVVLTATEVSYLAQDDAIVEVATLTGNDGRECEGGGFVITREGFRGAIGEG